MHEQPHMDRTAEVFVTTRWTRVILAGDASAADSHDALSSLCRDYWRPLYHFARRRGHSPEDSQDLTQGFIFGLLEKNRIARADRTKGRFRTFLISAFCDHLANERRNASALKRGGGMTVESLDAEASFVENVTDGVTPELEYERAWALALLRRVMVRLRQEYEKARRLNLFEALQPYLGGGTGRPGYATLGLELGMSEGTVTVAMHRMRRRYGELLRDEVAETLSDEGEIEAELRHLVTVVSQAPGKA